MKHFQLYETNEIFSIGYQLCDNSTHLTTDFRSKIIWISSYNYFQDNQYVPLELNSIYEIKLLERIYSHESICNNAFL